MKKALYILIILLSMSICNKISAYTEYKIGDVVPYNGMNFYVIKNSDSKEDTVTMLKAEPLTVAEVNQYGGVGTANNHVNMYAIRDTSSSYYQTAYDNNGYGGMAYYSSETCGYNGSSGCTNDYDKSEVKYVVDSWKAEKAPVATEARLIQHNEFENLGYVEEQLTPSDIGLAKSENTPSWVYGNYHYWTMSSYNDSNSRVWYVSSTGAIDYAVGLVFYGSAVVRPVITLKKTELGDVAESIVNDNTEKEDKSSIIDTKDNIDDTKNNEFKTTVKVDNTYMSSSILLIILGFITASISVFVLYKFRNKSKNN